MIHIQEQIVLYYIQSNIQIVKHVIEIIHAFHVLIKHFLVEIVRIMC